MKRNDDEGEGGSNGEAKSSLSSLAVYFLVFLGSLCFSNTSTDDIKTDEMTTEDRLNDGQSCQCGYIDDDDDDAYQISQGFHSRRGLSPEMGRLCLSRKTHHLQTQSFIRELDSSLCGPSEFLRLIDLEGIATIRSSNVE